MADVTLVPEVRTSERQLHKRCPWAWNQAYRFGMRSKRVSDPLWFGELVHIALATWYVGPGLRRGAHPAETFEKLSAAEEMRYFKTKDATEEDRAKYTDMRALGAVMLEGYVDRYGRDDSWHVISPEQTFSFNIPFPDTWDYEESREFLARYVGTYDLVYRDLVSGWIWLGEHKTAKVIRVDHLPLDDQAGPYFATAKTALLKQGLISSKDAFKGIMYNFLRKGLPDPRPVDEQGYVVNKPTKEHYISAIEAYQADALTGKESLAKLVQVAETLGVTVLGERSKVQPSKLFLRHPVPRTRAEQASQLKRMQDDLVVMEHHRRGLLPITKTTHHSCARYCDFYDICRLHEASGNWKELRSVSFTVQDPYAAHRKSTDEIGTFEL